MQTSEVCSGQKAKHQGPRTEISLARSRMDGVQCDGTALRAGDGRRGQGGRQRQVRLGPAGHAVDCILTTGIAVEGLTPGNDRF